MTVEELREALVDVPGDWPVRVTPMFRSEEGIFLERVSNPEPAPVVETIADDDVLEGTDPYFLLGYWEEL